MSPVKARHVLEYHEVVMTPFTVLGGAPGWIDTDVSAHTGLDAERVWTVNHITAGFATQDAGVRKLGSTVDTKASQAMGSWAVQVGAAGHVELYRGAADCVYFFKGYLR